MSLKDKFDKFIDYFTEDGEEVAPNVAELKPEKTLTSVFCPHGRTSTSSTTSSAFTSEFKGKKYYAPSCSSARISDEESS